MNLHKTVLLGILSITTLGLANAAETVTINFKTDNPFVAEFMALPSDASKPLLVPTAGKPTVEDGKLALINSRFVIGALSEGGRVADSTNSDRPAGVLDLSKAYTITVKVAEASTLVYGKDNFIIYVNNSTSKKDQSPLGGGSEIVKVSVGELKVGDNVFKSSKGDATSFLQFRTESGASLKIESISIAPR